MNTEIKLIAQFHCTIIGSITTEMRDIVLIKDVLYSYIRNSTGKFNIEPFTKEELGKEMFDNVITDPKAYAYKLVPKGSWSTRGFMPEEYYINIHHFYLEHKRKMLNKSWYINKELNKFRENINQHIQEVL